MIFNIFLILIGIFFNKINSQIIILNSTFECSGIDIGPLGVGSSNKYFATADKKNRNEKKISATGGGNKVN